MGDHQKAVMSTISDSQLETLCAALGWHGGTYWQVVDEVRRIVTELERLQHQANNDICTITELRHKSKKITNVYLAIKHPAHPFQLKAHTEVGIVDKVFFDLKAARAFIAGKNKLATHFLWSIKKKKVQE